MSGRGCCVEAGGTGGAGQAVHARRGSSPPASLAPHAPCSPNFPINLPAVLPTVPPPADVKMEKLDIMTKLVNERNIDQVRPGHWGGSVRSCGGP